MLETVDGPAALRALAPARLPALAAEIRAFLVEKVSAAGGHLGPNLGVVELTMALHRVFDVTAGDVLLFDTGHQAYVHKLLTGRRDRFDVLRQEGGLSGYPSRGESAHDWIENSHASTALSYADGLAKARGLSGEAGTVVAVVGDGALTGGMAWEALNNLGAGGRGRGYGPAETDQADRLHAVSPAPPAQVPAPTGSGRGSWTSLFSRAVLELGEQHDEVVAVTAAMSGPTGLAPFAEKFPRRFFDVGIAEQHAVTSAAGLAMGGLHPVVAVYATFLNRAFDQVLMDVALHRLPVTFVLDRAGITGPDGPSHHGMWDASLLSLVPGLRLALPRDGARLRELLAEAVACASGPTAPRFPKGAVAQDVPALRTQGTVDVLAESGIRDVLLVAYGPPAAACLEAAAALAARGIGVTVVDPRWALPVSAALADLAARHRLVVTAEDSSRTGGLGSVLAQDLADHAVTTPLRTLGLPRAFIPHGERGPLLARAGAVRLADRLRGSACAGRRTRPTRPLLRRECGMTAVEAMITGSAPPDEHGTAAPCGPPPPQHRAVSPPPWPPACRGQRNRADMTAQPTPILSA
nr:1-deoxy-D-xylulose-5-phosphate synthase [Streptomyces sp. L-9-10]